LVRSSGLTLSIMLRRIMGARLVIVVILVKPWNA
jgi:hypothetical protein